MSNTWQSVETALFPIVSSINQYLSNYILVFLLLSVVSRPVLSRSAVSVKA